MFFQAKQSRCSPGSKSGGGSTESVHVSVNRHDMMLYVHVEIEEGSLPLPGMPMSCSR